MFQIRKNLKESESENKCVFLAKRQIEWWQTRESKNLFGEGGGIYCLRITFYVQIFHNIFKHIYYSTSIN